MLLMLIAQGNTEETCSLPSLNHKPKIKDWSCVKCCRLGVILLSLSLSSRHKICVVIHDRPGR